MDSENGTTSTVKLNTASAPSNGNVPSVGTSEPPPDVDVQPSLNIHDPTHDPTHDWYLYALAGVVVLGFFAFTIVLLATQKANNEVLFMMFGGLVTGFGMVLSYFFGSSSGSAIKTEKLVALFKETRIKQQSTLT